MSEVSNEKLCKAASVSAFPRFLKQLVFLPFVQYPVLPRTPDLSNPKRFGLKNTTYQKILPESSKSKETLGSWFMEPTQAEQSETIRVKEIVNPTVVLYLHGNAHNRAQSHRVELYKLLQEFGCHVLAVDYRGYGDSSPVQLSETTVVEDAKDALSWIQDKFGNTAKIFVLGHSLGAAVATHMVSRLHQEEKSAAKNSATVTAPISGAENSPVISGLILQSPFNKMFDEVMTFSAAKALSSVGVDVEDKLRQGDMMFDSQDWLPRVECPVVIFHAQDDKVIPFSLGKKLFENTKKAGKEDITFVAITEVPGCGHKNLYKSKDFLKDLKNFLTT